MRLAIDTSTRKAVLGLEDDGQIRERRFEPRATQKVIFAELANMLDPDTLASLDGIVVGLGPGSFTGVKIGVMAAKALAWSRGIPLVGVGSLDAVAAASPVPQSQIATLVVGVPSTRGEAYVRVYRPVDGTWRVSGPIHDVALTPEVLTPILPQHPVLISGEAADDIGKTLFGKRETTLLPEKSRYPTAKGLLALAEERFEAGETHNPMMLTPDYIRLTQPEKLAEERPK